jgi:hypothetical protein
MQRPQRGLRTEDALTCTVVPAEPQTSAVSGGAWLDEWTLRPPPVRSQVAAGQRRAAAPGGLPAACEQAAGDQAATGPSPACGCRECCHSR